MCRMTSEEELNSWKIFVDSMPRWRIYYNNKNR